MTHRKLGTNGPAVSPIGLGCMGMGGSYGAADEAEAVATVQEALELGLNLIDTADFYGPGTSEKIVGKALAGRRDSAVVATKTGMRRGPQGPYVDGSPEYVKQAVDLSLERLGIDHIDLYYVARVDPNVQIEETIGALKELVEAGKVRSIGLCEASPRTLRRAHAVHPISALQTEYSLWERHVEAEILPTLSELGTTLVAYRPLGSGFFAGSISDPAQFAEDDLRRMDPRFQGENFQRNQEFVATIAAVAEAKGVTPSQLALAWVLAQGENIVTIPGTKRRTHLGENASAVGVELTQDELDQLAKAFPVGAASGTRYAARLLTTIDAS